MFTLLSRIRSTTSHTLIMAGLISLFFTLAPSICFSQSLIVKDFEAKNLDGFNYGTAGNGNQPTVVSEQSRAGRYSMKSYLNRLISKNSYRTEVTFGNPKTRHNAFNKDYWFGFSIFLPLDYEESEVWEILAQWHAYPDFEIGEGWRSPPLALEIRDGNWCITHRWDAKRNSFQQGKKEIDGVRRWELNAIDHDKGKWVDWVFHIKWSWGQDGLLEIWKDGALALDHRGPNTYNDRLGPYFKLGIYSGWRDSNCCQKGAHERTVYHDEIRIASGAGASYATVAPRSEAKQQKTIPQQIMPPSKPVFSVN